LPNNPAKRHRVRNGPTSFERNQDILKLTDKYGDVGYAFVNIEPDTDIDQDKKTVDIRYKIDKGPEVTIDKILITGNTKTRDKVLRRELKVQEGTLYINNPSGPCLSCNRLLDRMLEPGARLNVVWPGGAKTYEGIQP